MAPRVHPCICGFMCPTYATMKRHRRKCTPWRNRSHPTEITSARLKKTRQEQVAANRWYKPCIACKRRPDRHLEWCPYSQVEAVRRQVLLRHGINPKAFEHLLRVLARRYEGEEKAQLEALNELTQSSQERGEYDPAKPA